MGQMTQQMLECSLKLYRLQGSGREQISKIETKRSWLV